MGCLTLPPDINARFFILFGLALGALFGFVFSQWMPMEPALISVLYSPLACAIIILGFFVPQFGLGVMLNRPNTSREIYFGLFVIPITYTISAAQITKFNFFSALLVAEVPALTLFIASYYFFSPLVTFFVGFDTRELSEEKIPVQSMFGFEIQRSTEINRGPIEKKEELNILARILNGLGLATLIHNEKDNNGLIICRKDKLYLGIAYEFRIQGLAMTFIPFTIVHDRVRKTEDLDKIFDLKAQITGMLYSWLQKKLILMFNEISPNYCLGSKNVSEGLGPLKKPLIVYLRESVGSFPKNHPYRFALLISGFVIIINVTLLISGKLVLV